MENWTSKLLLSSIYPFLRHLSLTDFIVSFIFSTSVILWKFDLFMGGDFLGLYHGSEIVWELMVWGNDSDTEERQWTYLMMWNNYYYFLHLMRKVYPTYKKCFVLYWPYNSVFLWSRHVYFIAISSHWIVMERGCMPLSELFWGSGIF